MGEKTDKASSGIDDRWLDLAAEKRRIIKSSHDQIAQLSAQIKNHEKRRDTATEELDQIKASIAAKAPFADPEPKK